MTLALYGLGVSRGIAIGQAYVLAHDELRITEYKIAADQVDKEIARFEDALDTALQQLQQVRYQIPTNTPVDIQSFIDTHLLMLKDAALAQVPIDTITMRRCNAEWALQLQRDALVNVFEAMDDAYLRTRRDDVDFVVSRVQRILLNRSEHPSELLGNPLRDAIVLADDLSPADVVLMQHQGIAAFITEFGGTTSHTAILARSLGIPALVGVHNARRYLKDGELLIVDGRRGVLLASPDDAIVEFFISRRQQESATAAELNKLKGRPAITHDGKKVNLLANVELHEDLVAIERVAAEGIGLYRTEMLFMNRPDLPSEEEQLETYLNVLNAVSGAPVTIRSLDIGGDKNVTWPQQSCSIVSNPALSLRGIRLCLKETAVFRVQLRAILRASAYGEVRLMLPMLSNLGELTQVRRLIDTVKKELTAQGLKFNSKLPVGGMIEVPAAALSAEMFAKYLDFLSIGTNDLIQYTVAADRIDDAVSYLYDPLHPGVLRLIKMTIDAGNTVGIPVAMCGEMAGDIRYTRLLLGLGLREFSMHPAFLLEVKRRVNNSDFDHLKKQVGEILPVAEPAVIVELVDTLNDDL